ncbi:hypothetical protein NDU88_008411 [Pleurodeles waltl]|uniref:Uncharacterized protein n=1 Tax=Pleurodeles waltl TaxID=8319 RepID=A0AAV7QUG2_PLEWA|nr:hypothetical protein NDU88_008411 [Pleurodeles waltl]
MRRQVSVIPYAREERQLGRAPGLGFQPCVMTGQGWEEEQRPGRGILGAAHRQAEGAAAQHTGTESLGAVYLHRGRQRDPRPCTPAQKQADTRSLGAAHWHSQAEESWCCTPPQKQGRADLECFCSRSGGMRRPERSGL